MTEPTVSREMYDLAMGAWELAEAETEALRAEVERLNKEDNAEQLLLESIVNRLADEGEALRAGLAEAVRLLRGIRDGWPNDDKMFDTAMGGISPLLAAIDKGDRR